MIKNLPQKSELSGHLVFLRPPKESDYPSLRNVLSDLKTMEYLKYMAKQPNGWTLEDVKERNDHWTKLKSENSAIDFIIELLDANRVVGSVGLKNISLDHRHAEFGAILHHTEWGTGVSAEIHLLVLEYAFEVLQLHRIEWRTFTDNKRMCCFLEKLNITKESHEKECYLQDGEWKDDFVYVLFDREWPSVKKSLELKVTKKFESE